MYGRKAWSGQVCKHHVLKMTGDNEGKEHEILTLLDGNIIVVTPAARVFHYYLLPQRWMNKNVL